MKDYFIPQLMSQRAIPYDNIFYLFLHISSHREVHNDIATAMENRHDRQRTRKS